MKKSIHLILAVLFLGGLFVSVPQAHASSFTVNDTSDDTDRNPGNGQCRVNLFGTARCTLRAAIMEANALAGPDIIILPAGTYRLTRAGPLDATAENGDLDIRDDVTIQGDGAATTIIDGNGSVTQDRVFDILLPACCPRLTLSGVTVQGGRTTGHGGGIGMQIGTRLTLVDSVVTGNYAEDGGGGILAQEESQVEIRNSTISFNTTDGSGAGFMGMSEYQGGTIWNFVNSTFSGNSADGHGGGLFFAGLDGTLAPGGFGADVVGPAKLFNVTITKNVADADSAGGGDGGGVAGVAIELRNTLIGGNSDKSIIGLPGSIRADCMTKISAGDHDLIQKTNGCIIPNELVGMITGESPNLGVLQNNGGPTPTHFPGSGSPAIDTGNPRFCQDIDGTFLFNDQRGLPRHASVGGGAGRCDIGAVEVGFLIP